MKRIVFLLPLLCLALAAPVRALQLTDDHGATLTFAQAPHRHQDQREGDIRSVVGQHIRRVGNEDVVLGGIFRVDVIVADAERGDDLDLGIFRQHGAVGWHQAGHGNATDFLGDTRRQPFEIVLGFIFMQYELIRETVIDQRLRRSVDQQVDFVRRDSRPHYFSFRSALSCQRRNTMWDTSASSI